MRGLWALALTAAACGSEQTRAGPRPTYEALEARVEIDCGAYTNNTPADEDVPLYLCGEQPDVACINDAIAGTKIARLEYSYLDPSTLHYREQSYFAGDGTLVWIGFFEGDIFPAWYHSECRTLAATSFEAAGTTCWKLAALDCVRK